MLLVVFLPNAISTQRDDRIFGWYQSYTATTCSIPFVCSARVHPAPPALVLYIVFLTRTKHNDRRMCRHTILSSMVLTADTHFLFQQVFFHPNRTTGTQYTLHERTRDYTTDNVSYGFKGQIRLIGRHLSFQVGRYVLYVMKATAFVRLQCCPYQ